MRGQLDECWSDWFDGLVIAVEGDSTTLTGPVADQAALRGILGSIWDLNLTVIAVEQVTEGADPTPAAATNKPGGVP